MKCVIPGTNVKILARAIHALGKIGEEMYVQPQIDALSFRSVSMSNSAYCDFTFRDNYFSYYNYGDLNEEDALRCKIAMRGPLSVFKTPGTMDKLIETCHIVLEPNAIKLIFILKYKNGVTKTFLLPILNCEALQAAYNKDGLPNQLLVQPKVLGDALQNFQQNLIEITLDVNKEKILMRNYVNAASGAGNATRTQLALAVGEFDTYKIGQETCVTFCMKELRAILSFADTIGIPIHIIFELAGRPIVFVLRNPAFEANLVLSTLNPEPPDAPDVTIQDRRQALKKRNALKRSAIKPSKPRAKASNKSASTTLQNTSHNNLSTVQRKTRNNTKTTKTTRETAAELDADVLVPLVRSTSLTGVLPANKQQIDEPQASTSSRTVKESRKRTSIIAETPSSVDSTQPVNIFSNNSSSSTFSSPSTRRRIYDMINQSDDPADESVPNSPPRQSSKKARLMFKKCFQATFDPKMLPGHDEILAKDSDSE